jgi:hypothetical protein
MSFKIPDYYNYQKEKPKEEVLIERKCNMCGKLAEMRKFERYCSPNCRTRATNTDSTTLSVRFR